MNARLPYGNAIDMRPLEITFWPKVVLTLQPFFSKILLSSLQQNAWACIWRQQRFFKIHFSFISPFTFPRHVFQLYVYTYIHI